MKAIICPKYGPPEVLQLREVSKPVPKDNQILIKNHATTALLGDCEIRGFNFSHLGPGLRLLMRLGFGLTGPRRKILGQQLAGVVEEIGKKVTKFKPGDEVYACTGLGLGSYAEYKTLSENGVIAFKPKNMTFEEASTIPVGGSEALHFIGMANIQSGQTILVNGAGGSIGIIAVQLARSKGAVVTAVDSGGKFEMLKSLGANHCIDYKQENFWNRDEKYDVILDVVGVAPFDGVIKSLAEGGRYVQGNGSISRGNKAEAEKKGISTIDKPADYAAAHLVELRNLIESETIRTFIDSIYRLEQMADVHRFIEAGGKRGNVVVTMG